MKQPADQPLSTEDGVSPKVSAMTWSSVRAIALLTIVALALAGAPGWGAASEDSATATVPRLQGKTPVCSSIAFVLLAARVVDPASSVPYQLSASGHFFDALGSEYVATAVMPALPRPAVRDQDISPFETTGCGSVQQLTIEITDVGGYNVKDGTAVGLTASLGMVPEMVETRYGLAYVSFLAPSGTQGMAEVFVQAGAASASKKISITCA
jgi:hypothetical protein